jgi:hypothetical protein
LQALPGFATVPALKKLQKKERVMRLCPGLALAAVLAASVSSSAVNAAVENGVLECRGQAMSYVLASVTQLECMYRSPMGGPPHAYRATIRRVGVDIGINQSTVLAWAVFAPVHQAGVGDLGGTYFGASANATVAVGAGVNVLWGGSNNTIALQPVSVQGQTGFGAAGGISALELVPAGPPPRRHRRR